MKYGLMLATGQLGWEATPEVAGRLWRRLKARMASCDLDVVNPHGCRALCRFMYTEHGFAMPIMHDGGSHVHYREVATELWERLAKRNSGQAVVKPVLLPVAINCEDARAKGGLV